jgi:hypothetical protein
MVCGAIQADRFLAFVASFQPIAIYTDCQGPGKIKLNKRHKINELLHSYTSLNSGGRHTRYELSLLVLPCFHILRHTRWELLYSYTSLSSLACSLLWTILRPWRWRRYVPPKRRVQLYGLHGVISQKIILFKQLHVSDTGITTNNPLLHIFIEYHSRQHKNSALWSVQHVANNFGKIGLTMCNYANEHDFSRNKYATHLKQNSEMY